MNKKINIVIPMAGDGKRFKEAGFEALKPFILIDGKMMIESVLESFCGINANFYVVIQEKFLIEQKKELEIVSEKYGVEFITVPGLTMGAACTCMAAHEFINNESPVLFADSDTIYKQGVIENFLKDAYDRNLDASLLTFKSSENCFSYAKLNAEDFVMETKEKNPISENAITGAYYYKRGVDFLGSAIDLVVAQDIQKGEFYMSGTYNYFVKKSEKIGIYNILQEDFDCVGTPEQLKIFSQKTL